jgi:hypothetical protein
MNYDSTFPNGKQPVFNGKGKVVGHIFGRTLFKNVSGDQHMLRNPKGWAWDTDILNTANQIGVTNVEISDRESGKTYKANIKDFWTHGIEFNRGFGNQIVLCIQYWTIENPGEPPAQQLKLAL